MKTRILIIASLGTGLLLGACERPAATPTPSIVGTWIDAPESDSTLLLAPYTIVFHSASVMGMDEFELSINGELIASVPPKTTGPGGSQGTLFMADYEWYPPDPGIYLIEVRSKDQGGLYGAAAQAQVTVLKAVTELGEIPEVQPQLEQVPTGLPTLQTPPTPTPTLIPPYFGMPEYSTDVVYTRGTGCGSKQVDIQIQASDPAVHSVVLFVRLEELNTGEKTAWTVIPMMLMGDSYYGHKLMVESELPDALRFRAAHLQVQIVATDQAGKEIGRTPVESELMLERCSS